MQNRLSPQRRDRFATMLTALLLVVGLYAPTSLDKAIAVRMYLIGGLALSALLVVLLLRRRGVLSIYAVLNAAAINIISVREIRLTPFVRRLFDFCNAVNIALAVSLVLEVPFVTQFFLTHYAFGYEELLPYMIFEGKPVLMFDSHSVAGFFFYVLSYLTFQIFAAHKSKLNLLYALCYICLLGSLYSFTSVVFTSVAIVQVILHFQWHKSFFAGTVATAISLIVAVVLLRPIGLALSRLLWYTDCGPVEYLLKGSFPLLLTVYGGAFQPFLLVYVKGIDSWKVPARWTHA